METCSSFLSSFFLTSCSAESVVDYFLFDFEGGWRLAPPRNRGNVQSAPLLPPLGGGWSLAPPLDSGVVRSAPAPAPAPALGRKGWKIAPLRNIDYVGSAPLLPPLFMPLLQLSPARVRSFSKCIDIK